jgi:hypothetical protein
VAGQKSVPWLSASCLALRSAVGKAASKSEIEGKPEAQQPENVFSDQTRSHDRPPIGWLHRAAGRLTNAAASRSPATLMAARIPRCGAKPSTGFPNSFSAAQ